MRQKHSARTDEQYRDENKDRRQQKYRQNQEEIIPKMKQYYEASKYSETIKEKNKNCYDENRVQILGKKKLE